MCTNFQTKRKTDFLGPNLRSKFQKSKSGFGTCILEILCVSILRQNRQLWLFGPKFAKKWNLGSKFQKSKFPFGISILEIPHAPTFRWNRQLWMFRPKFAQKWILRSKFQKSKSGFRIIILGILQFSEKTDNFEFLGPNLPKNGIWHRNFQNLSLVSELTSPIYRMWQFSVKMDNF